MHIPKHYRHTQIGTILLGILGAALLALLLLAPDLAWVAVFYVPIVLLLGWLTVEIDDEFLVCRFGVGLVRKRFPLSDISQAATVRNRWYYGWGIRWTPHGWLFNAAGMDAVQIGMRNGKSYRIGTDQPQQLLEAIQRRTGVAS